MNQPTVKQVLGAKIRAVNESYVKAHRKPYPRGGGYQVPSQEARLSHLSSMFHLPPSEVSYYLTYSRSCTHPWSAGACPRCPT